MPVLSLEDFDTRPAPATPAGAPAALTEADRAAAYEDGYKAGWDDAIRSRDTDEVRVIGELGRCLQEMTFTHHEARAHVIQAMDAVLDQLLTTLLPGLTGEALALHVAQEIRPLIAEAGDSPVDLVVGPGTAAAMAAPLAEFPSAAFRVTEEPTLSEGQAHLRLGRTERKIDLAAALDRIRDALTAARDINERTLKHG